MTVNETLNGVKSCVEVAAEQERNLGCTVALVNIKRQGDSDG